MKESILIFWLFLTSIVLQAQTSERLNALIKDDNFFKSSLGFPSVNDKSLIFSDAHLGSFLWYSAKKKHPRFGGAKVERIEYLFIEDTISIISIHFRNPDEVVSVKKYLTSIYGSSSEFPSSELTDENLRADKIKARWETDGFILKVFPLSNYISYTWKGSLKKLNKTSYRIPCSNALKGSDR